MRNSRWLVRACAVAMMLFGGMGSSLRAAEAAGSDLALVPGDCGGFVTVRFAELLGKLGVKESDTPSWLAEMSRQLKLAPLNVERLTLVGPSTMPGDPVWIVRSVKPLAKKDILAALSDAEEVKQDGKTFHASSDESWALHFAGDRILIGGSKDSLAAFLKRPIDRSADLPSFTDA